MEAIYLDHAATSPMANGVVEAMIPVYKDIIGNASSVHPLGGRQDSSWIHQGVFSPPQLVQMKRK